MQAEQLFAQYGFTQEAPHTCNYTGNLMRMFTSPTDEYGESACYIDTVTGQLEVDVATTGHFFDSVDDPELIVALEAARADVVDQ